MKTPGWATPAGTEHYRGRFDATIPLEHFRHAQGLWLSSIGIGTYLGNYDDATDQEYRQAIVTAVESGCNVIDSAINYRLQRSERAIGAALKELAAKTYRRDEIVVATKGGFIPYDGAPPADPRTYIEANFIKTGLASAGDIAGGFHCMTPSYLLNQLDSSRRNLDLECIDIYYVHNPETQLGRIDREEFNNRLGRAFEALEGAVAAGKIRSYGVATWNAFRNSGDAKDYLSLEEVVKLAQRAGGNQHHFKVVQVPLNLGMTEVLSNANQPVAGKNLTLLEAAQEHGIVVMCSASMLQGQLTRNLPPIIRETFAGLATDGQRALQFVRSTPGVTTALVGMKQKQHVDENLAVARVTPTPWPEYAQLFQQK